MTIITNPSDKFTEYKMRCVFFFTVNEPSVTIGIDHGTQKQTEHLCTKNPNFRKQFKEDLTFALPRTSKKA